MTRDLVNISICRDSNDQDQDPSVVDLEGDVIPDSIILDSRTNEESLNKFRPFKANLSTVDKSASPNGEDKESKKANISQQLSLSTENSTEDGASPSPIEQSLITAFEGIQIGSLKAVELNRSKPKVLIKLETSSRLASRPVESTTAVPTENGRPSARKFDLQLASSVAFKFQVG